MAPYRRKSVVIGALRYRRSGPLLRQVFLSHSKDDPRLAFFSEACATAGVALRKMELEEPEFPPWRSIRREMNRSQILFVSLSEPLLSIDYRHTQNWIDYEVGLACQSNLPIWVFEPADQPIDFPVPYCTHSAIVDYENVENVRWLKRELETLRLKGAGHYDTGPFPKVRYDGRVAVTCINERCGLEFFQLNTGGRFFCPSCRTPMEGLTYPPPGTHG